MPLSTGAKRGKGESRIEQTEQAWSKLEQVEKALLPASLVGMLGLLPCQGVQLTTNQISGASR